MCEGSAICAFISGASPNCSVSLTLGKELHLYLYVATDSSEFIFFGNFLEGMGTNFGGVSVRKFIIEKLYQQVCLANFNKN